MTTPDTDTAPTTSRVYGRVADLCDEYRRLIAHRRVVEAEEVSRTIDDLHAGSYVDGRWHKDPWVRLRMGLVERVELVQGQHRVPLTHDVTRRSALGRWNAYVAITPGVRQSPVELHFDGELIEVIEAH